MKRTPPPPTPRARTRVRKATSPAPAAAPAIPPPPTTLPGATNAGGSAEATVSVLTAIRDIQSGALHPKSLSVEDRQRCVEHLTAEGYSAAEIAEVLKIGERMVLRDRKAIRGANALKVDEHFAAETVGGMLRHADLAISRLRRIARDRDTPPAVKVDAERASWDVARDVVQMLQRLGHLPTAAHEIRGELTHRLDDAPSLDDLNGELARLQHIMTDVASSSPVAPDIISRLSETQNAVSRLSLAKKVQSLTVAINTEAVAHDPHAE